MTNLAAKYLAGGSHNAIVGETPPVVALQPVTLDARSPRRSAAKAAAKKAPTKKAAVKKAPTKKSAPAAEKSAPQ
jgi:NADH dehydrogenase